MKGLPWAKPLSPTNGGSLSLTPASTTALGGRYWNPETESVHSPSTWPPASVTLKGGRTAGAIMGLGTTTGL